MKGERRIKRDILIKMLVFLLAVFFPSVYCSILYENDNGCIIFFLFIKMITDRKKASYSISLLSVSVLFFFIFFFIFILDFLFFLSCCKRKLHFCTLGCAVNEEIEMESLAKGRNKKKVASSGTDIYFIFLNV